MIRRMHFVPLPTARPDLDDDIGDTTNKCHRPRGFRTFVTEELACVCSVTVKRIDAIGGRLLRSLVVYLSVDRSLLFFFSRIL